MIHCSVTATLRGAMADPGHPIHLDGLLVWAKSQELGLSPFVPGESDDVEIPIVKCGLGIYQASSAMFEVVGRGRRYLNRKYPLEESFRLAEEKGGSINIGNGATKITHKPSPIVFLADGKMKWWASVTAIDEVERLLERVSNIGRLSGHGYGKIVSWSVVREEVIWEGFPVLMDGYPTRVLPLSYPSVKGDSRRCIATPMPPYWDRGRQCECYSPGVSCS